jgi:hypothetical protein
MRWSAWLVPLVLGAALACGDQGSGTDASTDAPDDAADAGVEAADPCGGPPPIVCVCPSLKPTCVNGNWECFGICPATEAGTD